ncbi:MAG TPA: hypothetical protein DCM87_18985 [Planctomycetes bacterium]|nr:hypothetical protein [Planctomycetota bacterium]
MKAASFSRDTREFLGLLHTHGVRYLIIGGEAVIYYGHARLTGDIDILFDAQADNADRLHAALDEFWGGSIPAVTRREELREPGLILQFGRPPNRIDLLNSISGVGFEDAWASKLDAQLETERGIVPIHYIGLAHLIANKESTGRPKDQDDLEFLRRAKRGAS